MNKPFVFKVTHLSLLAVILIVCTTVNVIPDIYDTYRNSVLLSSDYAGILLTFIFIFTNRIVAIKITLIDIFTGITLAIYVVYLQYINLWTASFFCLYLVYMVFRFGRFNYYILYLAVLLAALIVSSIGYLQYAEIIELIDGKYPVTGFYANSAVYGGVLCFLLSVLLPVWLSCYKNKMPYYIKRISIFVILFSLPPLIISNSRASLLSLFAVVIYLAFRRFRNEISRITIKRKILFTVLAGVILSFSGYGLYRLKSDSVEGRILIWKVTAEMIKDKPLFGYGENGFSTNYMHYQAKYLKEKGSEKEKYLAANNHLVFNEPVRVAVEYGMLGVILYIGYICLVFIRNKRFDIVSLTSKSFILAYLVWGLFSYPNKIFPALLYITIVTAFIAKREQSKEFNIYISPFLYRSIKITCLTASIALLIYHY
jgi:O-antigen ligase